MPVPDHPTHAKTQQPAGRKYGCWGRPRSPDFVNFGPALGLWPFRMSQECRYDMSLTDPGCTDCPHQGSGEAYARQIMEESV